MIYAIIYVCGFIFSLGIITESKSKNTLFDYFFVLLWPIALPSSLLLYLGGKFSRWL